MRPWPSEEAGIILKKTKEWGASHMQEFEQETAVAGDEDVQAAAVAVEAVEVTEEATVVVVEAEIEQTLTRTQVISRLKAIVLELEGGSLVLGGVPVDELADEVDFEIEYSAKDGKHELEIELEW